MSVSQRSSAIMPHPFWQAMLFQLLWLCPSCSPIVEDPEIATSTRWFPLEVGKSWTYEVDSVTFKFNGSVLMRDTVQLQARELVSEILKDDQGDSFFVIERYERSDTTQPWTFKKALSASITERLAFRTEDNLRLIKLSFPVQQNTSWVSTRFIDANIQITVLGETIQMFKGWKSKFITLDTVFTNGSLRFEDAILVSHADTENLIERRLVQEMYVQDLGLVFLQQYILDTQCRACCAGNFTTCGNTPWEIKAEKGFIVTQRLIGWN
jgi:hypothetical protein